VVCFDEDRYASIKELFEKITKDRLEDYLVAGIPSKVSPSPKEPLALVTELDPWKYIFTRKIFWKDYFWMTESFERVYPPLISPLTLPITDDVGFILRINHQMLIVELEIYHPSLPEPQEIAWDDQAYWHPFVLRWGELKNLCRFLSQKHSYPYSLLFLLLFRFAAITEEEDEKEIKQEIQTAFRSLDLFTESEISLFWTDTRISSDLEMRDLRYWERHPQFGWELLGEDAYSLRRHRNPKFPYQVLNELLSKVEKGKNV
jgi:hypothetical protein